MQTEGARTHEHMKNWVIEKHGVMGEFEGHCTSKGVQ